jgi:flavin reductase (DIM6/NTAB) family NADH-FMN oxidoreductase RutF
LTDPGHLRRVFAAYPTGVTAVAAMVDGQPVGMAINSFASVSLSPPLASICVARSSTTWPVLKRAARLGVSVLSADHEQACRQLSAKSGNRFENLRWQARDRGAVMLNDASAWLQCSVDQTIAAGDHEIVLMRIHDLEANDGVHPLVFHRSQFPRLQLR